MSDSTKTVSPLRQRMIEDMHMRKLKPSLVVVYNGRLGRLSAQNARCRDLVYESKDCNFKAQSDLL